MSSHLCIGFPLHLFPYLNHCVECRGQSFIVVDALQNYTASSLVDKVHLILKSWYVIRNILRYHFISKACILLISNLHGTHVSHTYVAIGNIHVRRTFSYNNIRIFLLFDDFYDLCFGSIYCKFVSSTVLIHRV